MFYVFWYKVKKNLFNGLLNQKTKKGEKKN